MTIFDIIRTRGRLPDAFFRALPELPPPPPPPPSPRSGQIVHLSNSRSESKFRTKNTTYRVVFWLVRPIFSTKMKNDGQPIRDFVPWNSRCTKDPHWLNKIFLFGTEIWADQLKKPPCIFVEKMVHYVPENSYAQITNITKHIQVHHFCLGRAAETK